MNDGGMPQGFGRGRLRQLMFERMQARRGRRFGFDQPAMMEQGGLPGQNGAQPGFSPRMGLYNRLAAMRAWRFSQLNRQQPTADALTEPAPPAYSADSTPPVPQTAPVDQDP